MFTGREGERRDVRELPVGCRELRVDDVGIGRGLPAGADDRMVPPDSVPDVGEQGVVRVGLDARGLRLLALQVQEAQEVLEVAGSEHEDACGNDADHGAAHRDVADRERPPARDRIEQGSRSGRDPDQARRGSGENESQRAGRDRRPPDPSACDQDGSESDRERERRESGEVGMAEERRLASSRRPGVGDVQTEELQETDARGDDTPGDDRRGDQLPVVAASQNQRCR